MANASRSRIRPGFGLSSGVSGATRLPVGEALARSAFQRNRSAHFVIISKRNAVAVPEIVFGQVAVQMLLCTMLVNTVEPPLEQAKEPLGAIHMDIIPLLSG
jgi:hypothetical protein